MGNPVLEVKNLGIDFGGLTAVNNLNLEVYDHEIVGLIGPNGAGKTTVFNMLTKVYEPTRGSISLDGSDIKKMSTEEVNMAGVARTFQNIRLFEKLSVIDNVKTGMNNLYSYSVADAIFHTAKKRHNEKKTKNKLIIIKLFDLSPNFPSHLFDAKFLCTNFWHTRRDNLCLSSLLSKVQVH